MERAVMLGARLGHSVRCQAGIVECFQMAIVDDNRDDLAQVLVGRREKPFPPIHLRQRGNEVLGIGKLRRRRRAEMCSPDTWV